VVQQVIMPKLGQTVEESTLVKWHKAEGDTVKKGDVLFEIETDKAVLESPSFYDGTLLKILVAEGHTVPVKSAVAFIGEPGEAIPEVDAPKPAAKPTASKPAAVSSASAPSPARPAAALQAATAAAVAVAAEPDIFRISPRAKRLAESKAIDSGRITGTGPQGRIVERDVTGYLQETGYDQLRITPAALALASMERVDVLDVIGSGNAGRVSVEDIEEAVAARPRPMSRMRQLVAERLTTSFGTAPHFYVTVQADLTELMSLRGKLKAAGKRYTVNDFIMKAVIDALGEFPLVNSLTDDGKSLRMRRKVHLGMAVALESGLVVPVIRNAQLRSLSELHDEASRLAALARDGKLTPDEMSGGTFTVSNMGMLDVENFTAIINPGESAILAVSSARKTPVVVGEEIQVRNLMKMTFSYDHRVIDGAVGAKFANAVKNGLEDIDKWTSLT
jgi:pyruvate dehydrogenase E2 component (dihydrolipoyllysine-residue acetyltransferase)